MKKIILFFILLISVNSFAQLEKSRLPITGVLTGKVIDELTGEALPYVNIVIRDVSKKIITGGITDFEGKFKIKKMPEGNSTVEIQFIGYKTYSKQITINKKNRKLNLGVISLSEDSTALDEVVVRAETSTVVQKIDRKVINVGKDLTAAGATASELLNNVQSVSVDSQTGEISLRGNSNVRVLVDGKPTNISTAQLLKQIPSTSIKSIELITNPSAKYNPEGMSGIINIILNKNANIGFNGSLNTGITQGKKTRFNGSLDMNYKTGKVNFFTNYGYNTGKRHNFGRVRRSDNNSLQKFNFDNDNESHLLKLGADIYLNDKNTISLYTIQNFSDNSSDGTVKITENGVLVNNSFSNSDSESNNKTYNFNYKIEFDKKDHNLEFEANLSKFKGPEDAVDKDLANPTDLFNNYTSDIKNVRKNNLYNLDYTNPVSKNGKLEIGLEVRTNISENENDTTQDEFVLNDEGSQISNGLGGFKTQKTPFSRFKYERDIYSAYTTYGHKFDKLSVQLGVRLEQYEIDGTFTKGTETKPVTDDIFSVYPSTFVTYNPDDKNQFQVSYSRRVDRPSLGQINPIRRWSTPRITSVGNSDLKPQFTNSYELNYTRQIKKGSLTLGTFYRRVNDNITRILNVDPLDKDKVLLSYTNTDGSNRYGVEASLNYRVANWWRINASTDLYIEEESGTANGNDLEVTNNAFNVRVSNSFKASKDLNFQLFAMYRGGGKSIQFTVEPMTMINISSSLNVLKGKGTISFRVNDIFKGMKFAFESKNPYPSTGQFNWESRTAYLGFSYRFGGGKNRAKNRRNRDNNEKEGGGGFM